MKLYPEKKFIKPSNLAFNIDITLILYFQQLVK